MKKQDLKSGMLVELRGGLVGIIFNDVFLFTDDSWDDFEGYRDDLTTEVCETLDIMRVSNIKTKTALKPKNWTLENIENDLLWQRPEPKEMIEIDGVEYELEEVKKLLANRSGDKIEPPKKKHVIEYDINDYFLNVSANNHLDICCDELIYNENGLNRKTKQNAEYSLKRNKRANRLEALVEDLQGELGVGDAYIFKMNMASWDFGTIGNFYFPDTVRMTEETAEKICELLNDGRYEL